MTISIIGQSVISREAMKSFIKARNANAPLEVVDAYYDVEGQWQGIRADVLLCQMCIETGYLTSWWSQPPRRNMAGIGVTGEVSGSNPNSNAWAFKSEDGKWYKGYSFADWQAAAMAHFGHMSAYCFSDEINNASQHDPRYSAAKQFFKQKGIQPAKVLTDLNGVWAVPGPTYGQHIEEVFNAALASAGKSATSTSTTPASATTNQWVEGVTNVVWGDFGPGTVNGNGSYVRARPSLDANVGKVVRKLDKGAPLHFSAYTDSGSDVNGGGTRWYLIADSDGGGWIYSKLIS
jgi:hypothetical protein